MAAVAILWLATAMAQAEQQWICVPGDGGRWNCSQGGETPTAAELPALEENTSPGPEIFNLPPPPGAPPRSLDAIDLLLPNPAPGAQADADRFTLVIASVSRVDEIQGFVDSYGLDPSLVRFVPVVDGEVMRQVVMWGSFASPAQAARALAGIPSAVRAMRPQVAEIASMGAIPRPLSALDDEPPAVAQSASRPAAEVSPSSGPDAGTTADRPPPTSGPAPQEIAAAEAHEAVEVAAVDDPAPAVPAVRPSRPALASAQDESLPAESDRQVNAAPAPDENTAPARPAATADEIRSSRSPINIPVPGNATQLRAQTRGSDRPSGFQPGPTTADARDSAAFAALDDQHYTVQLTSLKRAEQVGAWLRRHGLAADRVYALRVDEGAGPRTLLLFGDFATFSAAQTATRSLPGSIRSPWVRRISPLKQTLRDSP